MNYNGKIIVLAFPDTFVKLSDEFMCKVLPLVGLGTRTHIKAGHAALILIQNETGDARYFDFGRYITPEGKGRVRGALTDVELDLPFKAEIINNKLCNLDRFLLWLDANPQKTHGSGRLVASLCEAINYEKAFEYIMNLQEQGSIPYKAFGAVGSNCARFVTETILSATEDTKIIKSLKHNKKFTPSTVGNVEKCATTNIYEVFNGQIKPYSSSALRENLTNYFDKKVPNFELEAIDGDGIPDGAQLLTGIGSSAYFTLEAKEDRSAIVRRFTEDGMQDFEGITQLPTDFEINLPYHFVYDCNCLFCTVEQGSNTFRLELKNRAASNSMQMVHSA